MPLAPARAGGESEAGRVAGGWISRGSAGDVAGRNVDETDDDALPQPALDGSRGGAAVSSHRRGGADGRLRQDDAGAADGRHLGGYPHAVSAGGADADGALGQGDARQRQLGLGFLGGTMRGQSL